MSRAHNQPGCKRCLEEDEAHCGQSEGKGGILPQEHNSHREAEVYSTPAGYA